MQLQIQNISVVSDTKPDDVKPTTFAKSDPPVAETSKSCKSITVTTDSIEIPTTGRIVKYKQFKLTDPQRLVIDIYNVKTNIEGNLIPINRFGVVNARIGNYNDKIRIVLDSSLNEFPRYNIEKIDKGLKVLFEENTKNVKQEESFNPALSNDPVQPKQQVAKAKSSSIEAVDFKIVDDFSRVSIKINGQCFVSDPVKTKDGVVFTLYGCTLPNRQAAHSIQGPSIVLLRKLPLSSQGQRQTRYQDSCQLNTNRHTIQT
jgi:hypothetical protein